MGWQSAIVMVSTCEKTIWKIAPIGAGMYDLFWKYSYVCILHISEQIIHTTTVDYWKEFSPREPKCLNGVAVCNCDGQYLWENYLKNSPNWS